MKLDDLRAQIDAIDNELLTLLERRIGVVEQVGALKRKNGHDGVYIKPGRESDMMKRILAVGAGKFPKKALFAIWRAIISASLQVENKFRVFTTAEADKDVFEYFGAFTEYVVLPNENAVFKQISPTDVGVLPKSTNLANMPKDMKIFAEIGKFNAFAKIKEDESC